jgi:hypothetical protein
MPKHELMKSLEREGFELNYPDSLTNEEKIIEILKEKEGRIYLAIPLLLEKEFNYEKIKRELIKKKDGKNLMNTFNKLILISKEIFKKKKKNFEKLDKIILENKMKKCFTKKELEYFLEEYGESKRALEKKRFEMGNLEQRKKIDSFRAMETIFSPAKMRILRKIYEFKELNPTERMYYYRDIKPLIDSILDRNLQEYLEIVRGIRGGRQSK